MLPRNLRPMPDADSKRFLEELSKTPSGMRYRLASKESQIARKMIRMMLEHHPNNELGLQKFRRAYVAAEERASQAIAEMSELYGWPEMGEHNRHWQYRPPPRGLIGRLLRPRRGTPGSA